VLGREGAQPPSIFLHPCRSGGSPPVCRNFSVIPAFT
jgi:hypothetical protein